MSRCPGAGGVNPLPNDTAHLGLRFFNQGFVFDPGANQLGVIATNGGAGVIGAR